MYEKSITDLGKIGFLTFHHFLLFAGKLTRAINKLTKIATGKKRKNDFLPIKGTVSQGRSKVLKDNNFFLSSKNDPSSIFSINVDIISESSFNMYNYQNCTFLISIKNFKCSNGVIVWILISLKTIQLESFPLLDPSFCPFLL